MGDDSDELVFQSLVFTQFAPEHDAYKEEYGTECDNDNDIYENSSIHGKYYSMVYIVRPQKQPNYQGFDSQRLLC